MASKSADIRPKITLACTECKERNYITKKNRRNDPDRLEIKKFCPNCGREGTMRKAFATPAVHFKGSGWAKKDRSATSAPGKSRSSATNDATSGKDAAPAKSADPAPAKSADAD